MHLPEFYGMASNGSIDQSSKHKPDLSYGPNNELVELVWENGHVLFQGQSSRGRKNSPNPNPNSSNIGPSKMGGKFGFLDDFQTAVPSVAETGEEDMVPWLNYPMDELLPEISGVTANELELHQNSFVSVNKSNGKSFDSCNQPPPRDSFRHQDSVGGLSNSNTKIQNNFGFFNFSHFARPGTLGRANMENVAEESGGKGKESLMDNDNLATTREQMISRGQTNLIEDHHVVKRSEAVLQEEMAKNDRYPVREIEKTVEPIVAASSVCSVSSAERASNNSMPNLKRKRHETDESEEGRSDDVDEESVGVRKGASARAGCMGSKRSRAAEVHNLSERRRRDRINEKMRALQELIPNCNKVDKASMLDEAIEYLKTLQLQVQIMSMGAGLYMPQMMMQPFHPSHFSPMGMGFGMGMMDLNGGPPRNYHLQQQQHPNFMQGPAHHFPFARPSNGFQMFGQPSQGQHPAMSGPSPPPLVLPTVAGPISSTQLMVSPDVSNSPSPNQVIIAKNGASGSELPGLAHKKDPAAVVDLRSRDHQHAE